jgi:hypothetical protein
MTLFLGIRSNFSGYKDSMRRARRYLSYLAFYGVVVSLGLDDPESPSFA